MMGTLVSSAGCQCAIAWQTSRRILRVAYQALISPPPSYLNRPIASRCPVYSSPFSFFAVVDSYSPIMASHDITYSEKTKNPKIVAEITDSSDSETAGVPQERTLHRQLKNRHVAMIRCILFKIFFFHLMHHLIYTIVLAVSSELACS